MGIVERQVWQVVKIVAPFLGSQYDADPVFRYIHLDNPPHLEIQRFKEKEILRDPRDM